MKDRGIYRSAYESLADDADFQELSPLAQAIFWTLKLKLGQYGIGVFYVGALTEIHRKASSAAIGEALLELQLPKPGREHGWIRLERNVIWVVNGLRFEPCVTLTNDNHRKGALAHALKLPKMPLVAEFIAYYGLDASPADPPAIPPESPADGSAIPGVITETERERETEPEPETAKQRESERAREPGEVADAAAALELSARERFAEHFDEVDRFLRSRPPNQRTEWLRSMLRACGPTSQFTPEDVAGACSDALIADPPITGAHALRAFADKRRQERIIAASPPSERPGARSAPRAILSASDVYVDKILALVQQSGVSGAGVREFIPKKEVWNLGPPIATAYDAVGGFDAFIAAKRDPSKLHFLRRDFAEAFARAVNAKLVGAAS